MPGGGGQGGGHGGGPKLILELLEKGGADKLEPQRDPELLFHRSPELEDSCDRHESLAHTFGALEALLNTLPLTEGCPQELLLPRSNERLSEQKRAFNDQ